MEKFFNSPKTPNNNGVDPRINDVIKASSPLKESPRVIQRRRGSATNDDVAFVSSPMKESPKVTQTPRRGRTNDDVAHDVIEKVEDNETEKEKIETAIYEKKEEENEEIGDDNPSHENEEAIDDQYALEDSIEDVGKFLSSLSSTDQDESNEADLVEVPDFIDKFLDLLNEQIENYPKESSSRIEKFCPKTPNFLEAISLVSKLTNSLDVSKCKEKFSDTINRIGCIQQSAMSLLEDEFRLLLDECRPVFDNNNNNTNNPENKQKQDPENSNEEDQEFSGYPEDSMLALNRIAKEMILGGHETECCQVYIMVRRNVFEEILQKLAFESTSIDDVQKLHWETLEKEIAKWINTFTQCANVYFPNESKLSEGVFAGYSSISTHLFSNLTRSVMIQILNFAEAVAMMSRRSAEKLFKFLDMFETLRDVGSTVDGLFHDESFNVLKAEITTARSRLGEAIVAIFCDLENSIKSDTGKNPVPGGAVHPLTRYTMNYLEYACEYKETLEQVFKEHLKIERADSNTNRPEFQGENAETYGDQSELQKQDSPFSAQLMRVMDLLDSNLEGKSKLYKDVSLSNIFIMNNGRYILQHVKRCNELSGLLQDVWRRKKSSELRQCHKNYQRETWGKVLGCFKEEGLVVHGKVVKIELKERFKAFNAIFDEIHKTQSSWVVADEQLQSELRVSISAVVVPAYRSFLGRFSQTFTPGRQSEKYIKFQPEDLETYIDDLFDGNQGKKKT